MSGFLGLFDAPPRQRLEYWQSGDGRWYYGLRTADRAALEYRSMQGYGSRREAEDAAYAAKRATARAIVDER